MRPLICFVLLVSCTMASAADVPKETPPRKLLHAALIAECQKQFDIRKAEVEALKTPADIEARQKTLKAKFIEALGGFPEKTPLNAKVTDTFKRDGYRIEKVIYESRPEHHVTANLYIPEGKGPFPGVIMPIGHSQNGKAAEYMQRGALILVKNGFVALVYDPIGQGERSQLLDKVGNPAIKGSTSEHTMIGVGAILVGGSTGSYRIWDGIRSIDYLTTRPEVDATKIGCTGCSGGGTLTSYLMALDDRIAAAAPSCYLTSLERLFATLGPQDAEQNITGQVAIGLDHADYIFLRAPKPTIILASTKDFFDIQGTWNTYREAKRVYGKLGFPERLEMIESDNTHGYPKSHREAMARFFSRWLKGEDKAIVEGDWKIEKDADLRCTRTGQVLDDLKGRSNYDLNAALAADFAKQRAANTWKQDDFRDTVKKVVNCQDVPDLKVVEESSSTKRIYQSPSGVPIAGLAFQPKGELPKTPLVIMTHEQGNAVAEAQATKLAVTGRHVLCIEPRGYGETAPGVSTLGKLPAFGFEYKESFLSLHLNKPLLGQRVADLLGVFNTIPRGTEVELMGVGSTSPILLHAAVLNTRVKAVTIDGGLVSWENVVRTPMSHNQLANVVPGVLKVYDLPDLAAAIAPRPLTIRNPVDAAGNPLTKEAAEEAYKSVRTAFKTANASDKFVIEINAK